MVNRRFAIGFGARRLRGQHAADRKAAAAPVGRAADHDPHQPHLPVDQLATLFTERHVAGPATRAHPLGLRHVADLLLGREMGELLRLRPCPREPFCCPRPRPLAPTLPGAVGAVAGPVACQNCVQACDLAFHRLRRFVGTR